MELVLGFLAYCKIYIMILYDTVTVNVRVEVLFCELLLIGIANMAVDPLLVETCPLGG